jgi:WD40 repeat protein
VLWWAGDGHASAGSIWTNVPGRGLRPIVRCERFACGIWDPEWSPDGSSIAFARGMTIVTVEPDGSGTRELARCRDCTGMESGPTWSPDGSRIAFAASDANYHGAIFVMKADGSDLTRVFDCGSELCQGGLRAAFLDWSPTDDRLVFTLERNVWTMRPDGSALRRLTSCPVTQGPNACEPGVVTWSPDGTEIAYDRGSDGLVIMDTDGSDPREIHPGGQLYLDSWQPLRRPRADAYVDPTYGWSIEVPNGMTLFPIDAYREALTGAVISNVPIDHPDALSDLAELPSDGVVLRIWHDERGLMGPVTEDDASFPLAIDRLRRVDRYVGGSEPQPLYGWFFAGGTDFNVAVWFGEGARGEARDAIARALSTVRPAPTEVGTVLHDRMIVLNGASTYALGSVTRYDRSDLPLQSGRFSDYRGAFSFYLVHAPNGFYAISTDFLGNGEKCDLQVDRPSMTFSCPGTHWSWDREGRTLTRGDPWPDGTDDLLVLPTPISWDGHVMIDPFGNAPEEAMRAWSD